MPKARTKSNSQVISKFFRFRSGPKASTPKEPTTTDSATNGSPASRSTDKGTTINYSKKRPNVDEGESSKRQKLDPTEDVENTPSTSSNTNTAGPVSLSDTTKNKLEAFFHETDDKRDPEQITISELKRPDADHISLDDADTSGHQVALQTSSHHEEGDSDEDSRPAKPSTSNTAIKNKLSKFGAAKSSVKVKPKYTPLEQQFVDLKEKYPDAILFVECGYKYRFFGDDAEVAAKELNIFAHVNHSFMTASIPVHRLHVHVRRLVSKGYKVGVVKQTETAALKAAGDNRNTPFTRQLSALYTKTTLIGEDVDPVCSASPLPDQSSRAHLMCIYEPDLTSRNKSHQVAIVSIQPSTGEFVYDEFTDVPTRSELEMRVAHLRPAELLLPHSLTPATEKVIKQLTAFSCRSDDRIRLERMQDGEFEPVKAYKGVSDFYGSSPALSPMLQLPKPVLSCIHALITYLKDFNLHNVLKLSSNLRRFSPHDNSLLLPATTLRNLEVFSNLTNGAARGSLFWVLDHTRTRFGSRLLRQWVAKPLFNVKSIVARQEAVGELLSADCPSIAPLRGLLTRLPDVDKGLCTIFNKRCSTQEFLTVCQALASVHGAVAPHLSSIQSHVDSALLRDLLTDLPDLLDGVTDWVGAIDEKAAKDGDKTKLFVDESCYPDVVKCKSDITAVLTDLDDHRKDIAKVLGYMAYSYKTIMGTEFLIDVKNSDIKRVPKDWIKINGTKATSRFHSPFILTCYKKLSQLREKLGLVCNHAWTRFLESFEDVYPRFKQAIQHLATLDCLLSLATVAKQDGFCRPTIQEASSSSIHIEAGRHPVVDALLGEQEQYVPNDTRLIAGEKRCMVITGPNMGGKSSYIKQVALLTIMAQMGSYVPAEAATVSVVDAVFTRMGASDELFAGRSTFMVELQEASEVMVNATARSLVILDELGRGTSTHDGVAIAYATLKYFVDEIKCMTLFVTHYPPLAEIQHLYPDHVTNHHMSFLIDEDDDKDDMQAGGLEDEDRSESLTFLYQLVEGVAGRSYGLNVARLAGIPDDIIHLAAAKSRMLEDMVTSARSRRQLFSRLWAVREEEVPQIVAEVTDGSS